jgi:hypothetical protein
MPLFWVLRDLIGLTGTGCAIEVCEACTVLVDGQRELSCVFDVSSVVGKKVLTIGGLSADRSYPAHACACPSALCRRSLTQVPLWDTQFARAADCLRSIGTRRLGDGGHRHLHPRLNLARVHGQVNSQSPPSPC